MNECYYFGYREGCGHCMQPAPGQSQDWRTYRPLEYYSRGIHIDGALAPVRTPSGVITYRAILDKNECNRSTELTEGAFLRHNLHGYTAISWWDRCQGDGRPGSNSTLLVHLPHTSAQMLEALKQHFPRVLANLTRYGVELVEVFAS